MCVLCCAQQPTLTLTRQSLTYELMSGQRAVLKQCHDKTDEVEVPDTVYSDGVAYTIIGIAPRAFKGCRKLKQILLPTTIEYVGLDAFTETDFFRDRDNWDDEGCLWIDDILIGVKSGNLSTTYEVSPRARILAAGALGDNSKVRKLILPEGLRQLPDQAFAGCRKLRQIEIPHSVERIGRKVFQGTALYASDVNWTNGILYADSCAVDSRTIPQDLVLREGTRLMADGLLQDNRTLRSIDTGYAMERISEEAFADCRNLRWALLSDGMAEIGARAFMGCYNLSDGNLIPAHLHALGEGAFYECASLSGSIDLAETLLTEIPAGCFYRCEKLEEVTLGLCQFIGRGAFMGCTSLTKVELSGNLSGMDTGAFSGCSSLERIDLGACSLEIIPSFAFSGCTALKEVILPEICVRINRESFSYCINLTHVSGPDEISIHPEAFVGSPISTEAE